MSEAKFVHLNVHSDFSMLEASCRVSDVVDKKTKERRAQGLLSRAKDFGMNAMAITDYANMCATVEFFKGAKELKPIIGCMFFVAERSLRDQSAMQRKPEGQTLILLAKDYAGYQNLCRLNAISHLEGQYLGRPRIDKDTLRQHSAQLIGLSTFQGGEIFDFLSLNRPNEAQAAVREYQEILGAENFYLEIQNHGVEEEIAMIPRFAELSQLTAAPLVATNDVHYLLKEDAEAHEVLFCIGEKTTTQDEKRRRLPTDQYYFRSQEEMIELFKDYPEAISNTLKIAEQCDVQLDFKTEHYPVYDLEGEWKDRQADYLRQLCIDAMIPRYNFVYQEGMELNKEQEELMERLEFELGVIIRTGYSSYFLVVWDFILYSRDNGIPVGPGRGSGAGSMVAYLLGITNIDPLEYNLLFERFLNPERISPPDFDIDFCERRRYEVIDYVRNKYGAEKVSQIGTYGTLKAKAVVKDVTRALGYNHGLADQINKLIGDASNLRAALDENPDFERLHNSESWVQDILKHAFKLEGLNRQMGIHACGVIIGDQELTNLVPLIAGVNPGDSVTQFASGPCEGLGLLKMDFLGLRTLTIIDDALKFIKGTHNIDIDIEAIPIDDDRTYKLFQAGRTTAIFQYESAGMQKYMKELQPTVFPDLIAMNALYRPGPIGYIPNFIDRKHGREEIVYDTHDMEDFLGETYGITVYQEQVMLLSQRLAGFTKGEADTLRKAMGKKIFALLDELKPKFMSGGAERGHEAKNLEKIWTSWEAFAAYAFNKSHSTCYAWVAYQTAYLKAHYPAEFMAATLGSEIGNAEKITFFIHECKEIGLTVLPPDILESQAAFSIQNGALRYALGAIRGVGTVAAENIIAAREKYGTFTSFLDFCEKVEGVNRRTIENLIKAGAFDFLGEKRSVLYAVIETALQRAQTTVSDRAKGQGSLFDLLDQDDASNNEQDITMPNLPDWHEREKLAFEKDLLGYYATGHPLGEHENLVKTFSTSNLITIKQSEEEQGIKFGCMIDGISFKTSKKDGRPWAILNVQDMEDNIEVLCFSNTYQQCQQHLKSEAAVFVEGIYSHDDRGQKVIANNVYPIEDVVEAQCSDLHIRFSEKDFNETTLKRLKEIINNTRYAFTEYEKDMLIHLGIKEHWRDQDVSQRLKKYLGDFFGKETSYHGVDRLLKSPEFGTINGVEYLSMPVKKALITRLKEHKAHCNLILCAQADESQELAFIDTAREFNFVPSQNSLKQITELFGEKSLHFKADKTVPEPRRRFFQKPAN